MSRPFCKTFLIACVMGAVTLAGCSSIPTSGASGAQIARAAQSPSGIQIVDVTEDVARQLFADRNTADFVTALGGGASFRQQLGVGDTIQVSIWEAPPATLFGAAQSEGSSGPANARVTVLPDQAIDGDGNVNIPFAGQVKAAGRSPTQLAREIAARLKSMAHDPQVLVKLSRNETSYVTIVGDVAENARMALTARGERLLDALASAGGAKHPVDKVTIQITRGKTVASLPLDMVIRDPRQNVPLHAGDVVTVLFQPYSFTVLGATGKNDEINFEAKGITLAQALARAGGLQDSRADAKGVFIFRLEDANALKWPTAPVRTTADGKVPVVYRVNLRDPNSFFVAQSFRVDNNDLLYVSNAPIAELQKFLNVVFSVAYPVITGVQTVRY
ncbi:polysaccharide biosynthesis/export family protein [Burkholderia pseudomallei]|uniref:polysaccharide biosynthesis/export family protein n=1 Tax=Burkholderia pseudomallei TaxID=28450 RepID=UPI0005729BAE|nr:polysaccharide biosynthesis/export family protein [Burkholderia pseudomallei]MBM5665610.1 polysaccharide export protein [Burkholderia pseudomallei]OMY89892.1 capsular biosynthesis protein [Burkholderia pseudomallei]OMY98045.1 capsular biosynthesis protein [Burkholderia pseudomallei]OMZ08556.1 capsular biosynthesis protein [Burkholderia pseudomallei]OMZ78134.1 capsular biosynthesis protein [Burkholderia pseudomallei]